MPHSAIAGRLRSDRPIWQSVSGRFPDGRGCLASFLAFEAAEVLEQTKPANLVNIVNRESRCGRNLYHLWRHWGPELLADTGLAHQVLRDREENLLILFYDPAALATLLESGRARRFLARAGYPWYEGWREALDVLGRRLQEDGFPHEIGLFLGYPLKDVAGFMGWAPLPFACQGPWKIYGDPRPSLALAERHRACRGRMVRRLAVSGDPVGCLYGKPSDWDCARKIP